MDSYRSFFQELLRIRVHFGRSPDSASDQQTLRQTDRQRYGTGTSACTAPICVGTPGALHGQRQTSHWTDTELRRQILCQNGQGW